MHILSDVHGLLQAPGVSLVVHPEQLLSASVLREQWECLMPTPRSYRCFCPQEISLWENVPNEDIESMSKYEAHSLSEMGMSLLEGQTLGFQCLTSPHLSPLVGGIQPVTWLSTLKGCLPPGCWWIFSPACPPTKHWSLEFFISSL